MTEWTTVTVNTVSGHSHTRTEHNAWGQKQMTQSLPELPDNQVLQDVSIIACNSNTDIATIAVSNWDTPLNTRYHNDSLYTYHMDDMKRVKYDDNIITDNILPEWCHINGKWNHLDQE